MLHYIGYCFDPGTNLYYLQSRYYDAEVGRFINGDTSEIITVPEQILQIHLFAYCGNAVVINSDIDGFISLSMLGKSINAILEFFISIAKTAQSMSKETEKIVNEIKKAKRNGASKDWIKTLKKRKKPIYR